MLNFIDKEHIGDIFSDLQNKIKYEIRMIHGIRSTPLQQVDVELKMILMKLAELEYRLNKLEEKYR